MEASVVDEVTVSRSSTGPMMSRRSLRASVVKRSSPSRAGNETSAPELGATPPTVPACPSRCSSLHTEPGSGQELLERVHSPSGSRTASATTGSCIHPVSRPCSQYPKNLSWVEIAHIE